MQDNVPDPEVNEPATKATELAASLLFARKSVDGIRAECGSEPDAQLAIRWLDSARVALRNASGCLDRLAVDQLSQVRR